MRIFVIASGHALPAFESAHASFRGVGLGIRAPASGRNDSLDAMPRQLDAQGIDVIGQVRDQAGPRLGSSGFHQSRAGTGDSPVKLLECGSLGAEPSRLRPRVGFASFLLGCARCARMHAHDRAGPPHSRPIRIGRPVGHQTRPDAPITPA